MVHRLVLLIALSFLIVVAAIAQFDLGAVVGTVKDPSNLPMAGAAVEIRSLSTNVSRQTTTSTLGEFDFVALQPGQYSLIVRQAGFKEQSRKLELTVGQRAELNVAMEVGVASQSVTVGESIVAVETASSDLSNLRTRQQVVDLPLNGRNFTQLVQLAPGVNNHGNSTNVSNGGYTCRPGNQWCGC